MPDYPFGRDTANNKWVPIAVDSTGKLLTSLSGSFENPPTEDETELGPSSEWAFDHKENSDAHHVKTGDNEVTGLVAGCATLDIPAAGTVGRLIFDTETKYLYIDNGTSWIKLNNYGALGTDFEESPTDGQWYKAPSSNWAFDHKADASAHHTKPIDFELKGLLATGLVASRPAAGNVGRTFFDTATGKLYIDNGTSWAEISGGSSSASMDVNLGPNEFNLSGALIWHYNNFSVINCRETVTSQIWGTVDVPNGATEISSIKIFYFSESAGNLYLKFATSQVKLLADESTTNDATNSYDEYSNSDSDLQVITVPSDVYNGITLTGNDALGFYLARAATDATDTYDEDFYILKVEFKFA